MIRNATVMTSLAFGRGPRLTLLPISGQTFFQGILNLAMIHFTTTRRIRTRTIMTTMIRIMAPM